ncbi:AMP-dependent synthetase and ligase [Rippkaea orientalis PCC 8801]|uniref:AMP-dependent synthetase and ligase n=1 Tax=Rippkaea orientalis (strain PCC 8801 / RF-1) TaxID=41431 RepID=B7K021_RIPO1|nr:acyl-CoA synthetase [Rippkaea orientalis]ACK66168.1 AMP-dependent synthetase and ligase [Rippkaea orientalis PCC 8801]
MDLPLISRAQENPEKIAIVTPENAFTYGDLLEISRQIATCLLSNSQDLQEQRVAFAIPSGFEYVAVQWGVWRAGGIAVPLCTSHPRPELEHVIYDSQASIIIAHPNFEPILLSIAQEKGCRFLLTTEILSTQETSLPEISSDRRALILYTSGTTGKPKGVVTTHQNIQAQVTSLIDAWGWTSDDKILHVLPLHHIHGIINLLTCALWSGAQCHILPKFDAEAVWTRIGQGNLTLFMAVPTIYVKLITAWETLPPEQQKALSKACSQLRLMVSGSAALPLQVLKKWQDISGHFLLERYGMTEIGMALSNPLNGQRMAGYVGQLLPGVEVRLVDEQGQLVPSGTPGEIQVKSPGVFLEYWQKPEATAKAFQDGWFCTGDLAVVEQGNYRILGRLSVDIIKTGGYKVSALEIEETLRTHPDIKDCAVVGVEDEEWGQRVCGALVLHIGSHLTLESLRNWAKERLAVYKIPTKIVTLDDLPRNAMGKVTKPKVVELF